MVGLNLQITSEDIFLSHTHRKTVDSCFFESALGLPGRLHFLYFFAEEFFKKINGYCFRRTNRPRNGYTTHSARFHSEDFLAFFLGQLLLLRHRNQ